MTEYKSNHVEQNRAEHIGQHRAPEHLGHAALDDTNFMRPLPELPSWYKGQTVGVNALPLRNSGMPRTSPRRWLDHATPERRVTVSDLRHVPIKHTQDIPLELIDVGQPRR